MKSLPIISGWEIEQYREEAEALRRQADSVLAGKWCQAAAARDQEGRSVPVLQEDGDYNLALPAEATRYCMGSHLDYFTPHAVLGLELIEQVIPELVARHIPQWNDKVGRKAYQVARAFRAAAARAERYAAILEAEQVPA